MAVLSRINLNSQQRLDLSSILSMESYSAFDMRALVNSFVGDQTYIVRGFEITGSTGLSISITTSDAFVFFPDNEVSSIYYGVPGTADTLVNLDPNQPNIYLEASFETVSRAPQTAAFWNPLSASSASASGSEFSATQDSQIIVEVVISANTVQFDPSSIPLAIISTSASAILNVVDARPLLFRLGSGGTNPDPFHRFNWSPNRAEPQFEGTSVGDAQGSPYISSDINGVTNDKGIKSFKQSLDAIMTRIAEISGSPLWYTNSLAQQYVANLNLNIAYLDSPAGHSIQPSKSTAFRFRKGQLPVLSVAACAWVNAVNSVSVVLSMPITTNIFVGNQVTVSGFSNSTNNGTFTVTAVTPSSVTITNTLRTSATGDEIASAALTGFFSEFEVIGTESVSWRTNYQSIEWTLGGTYTSYSLGGSSATNYRSYASTTLSVNVPECSNVYLKLERETSKGSGNPVSWNDNSSNSGLDSSRAISGLAGDFTDIAIGDYVRKISEGISRYYQVVRFANSSHIFSDADQVADATITGIEVSVPIQGAASVEALVYWRKRYSVADVYVDPYQSHTYSDANYYWLGRKKGDLFILRDFGLLQANQSAFTDDNNFSTVTGGGGDSESILLEHGFGASLISGSYASSVASPSQPLLTIRRRKSDNTNQDAYLDNSDSLLTYTIPAAATLSMVPGQSLYARLSETTSGVLAAGTVVSTSDDGSLTDIHTNVYQVVSASSVPLKTFDNRYIFQIARCVTLEDGNNGLIFVDGSTLSFGGLHINNNVYITGSATILGGLNTYKYYYNATGTTIPANQVVQLTSVTNYVSLASALTQASCDGIVGVTFQAIPNNSFGLVQVTGDAVITTQDGSLIVGKPAYLSTTFGAVSHLIPSTKGECVFVVGQSLDTNKVVLGFNFKYVVANIYEEYVTVVPLSTIPGINQIHPISSGTSINLPGDSRDGGSSQSYVVGSGKLQIRLNGVGQELGVDWLETGATTSLSSSFSMLQNLVAGDVVTMRIELDQNEVLVINAGAGVKGSEGLQEAYLIGGTITVTPGFPVQIAGASGKLLHVAGDVAIDGIIDPTGITFTQQSSNPFDSSSHGLYVTNAGDLIFHATSSNPPVNLTQAASGSSASSNLDTYLNDSGVTITAISPVSLLLSGGVQIANPSNENSVYSLIGIMASDTLPGAEGAVYTSGRLPCGIFAYTLGDSLWLGQGGVLTNVKPSPGVDGFNTGDFVVQMGTVIQNKSNTAAVDILIRISIVGQL